MLALGGGSSARSTGSGSHSRSTSANGLGRRSGEIAIQEEDEDAVADEEGDYIEEVDSFSPVLPRGPGERIEEIYEDGDGNGKGGGEAVSPLSGAPASFGAR